ncbi:MAG: DUF5681 domain-containing protein, partial [Silvibacterium sp.]
MDKGKRSEFSIGYKKPPRHTQFKPGQSGNRRGRPKKKATTFAESIERELNTWITVNEGGKQRRITKFQAIAKQQTNKAVHGDLKATALVMRAVEPREFEQRDNLSPVLQEMRAIHAKHEVANQNGTRAIVASDLAGNLANDHNHA